MTTTDEDDPYDAGEWSPEFGEFHILAADLTEVEPVLEAQQASQQVYRWFLQEAVALVLCNDPDAEPHPCQRVADWANRPEHRPAVDLGVAVGGMAGLVAQLLPEQARQQWVDDLPAIRAAAQQSIDKVVKASLEVAELRDMYATEATK